MPDNISLNVSSEKQPSFKREIKALETRLKEIYYLCSPGDIKANSDLFAAILETKEFLPIVEESFTFDPADRYIRGNGWKVRLGKTQTMVFYRLAMNFDKIVSHAKLLNHIDNLSFPKKTNLNALRVQISLLRDALEKTNLLIECTTSQGYQLRYVDRS